MVAVEGPELVQEALVAEIGGILLHTHLPIGRGHGFVLEQLEFRRRTVSAGWRPHGEAKQQ